MKVNIHDAIKAATVNMDEISVNIRLVDCVGYVIKNAKGAEDEHGPRMVKTPWYNEEIPFTEAAEIGTEKVIMKPLSTPKVKDMAVSLVGAASEVIDNDLVVKVMQKANMNKTDIIEKITYKDKEHDCIYYIISK